MVGAQAFKKSFIEPHSSNYFGESGYFGISSSSRICLRI